MRILVTGAAGFIGFHVCKRFLKEGHTVVGIDNMNDYYDVALKEARLEELSSEKNFCFKKIEMADSGKLADLFSASGFTHVVHLAAQAGVRYSLINPSAYIQSNVVAFANLLECCRHNKISHLVYASSSSIYGMNTAMPFSTSHSVDHPVSLYAATKKSNELMAHTYSHLYALPTTGLRFFTVYGPWGRPDMALYIFTKAILEGKAIPVFNNGEMKRDFTYIDDIVEGVFGISAIPATADPAFDPANPDPATSSAPYRIYNIGNNNAVMLKDFIAAIEQALGKKATLSLLPMQSGDVTATYADIEPLKAITGFSPETKLQDGVTAFVDWYKKFHKIT